MPITYTAKSNIHYWKYDATMLQLEIFSFGYTFLLSRGLKDEDTL